MKPNQLLFIAFWFPPSRASGVYRALAVTNSFVEAGWKVTVVTTTSEFLEEEIGSIDDSLLSAIQPGVNVVRVPFSFHWNDPDLRQIGRFRGNFPILWKQLSDLWLRARDRVLGQLGSLTPNINEPYAAWIQPAVDAVSELDQQFDHIIATGNPYSTFEVARLVSANRDTAFSIDYRDPWTIDVFTGHRAQIPASTEAAERRIVDSASICVQVNKPIADAYRHKYPQNARKQMVVLNGFDPQSVDLAVAPYEGGPMRFGMLGTINDRWPLKPIFEAWADRRDEIHPASQLLLAGHLGYFARSSDSLRRVFPEDSDWFSFLGPIAKTDVAAFYSSLDVVIVPVPGSQMVTSGKIFEAMALGLPFICVQEEGGAARILSQEHPFSYGAEPNQASVGAAMIEAAGARRRQTLDQILRARAEMTKYDRSRTMQAMVRAVASVVVAQT